MLPRGTLYAEDLESLVLGHTIADSVKRRWHACGGRIVVAKTDDPPADRRKKTQHCAAARHFG